MINSKLTWPKTNSKQIIIFVIPRNKQMSLRLVIFLLSEKNDCVCFNTVWNSPAEGSHRQTFGFIILKRPKWEKSALLSSKFIGCILKVHEIWGLDIKAFASDSRRLFFEHFLISVWNKGCSIENKIIFHNYLVQRHQIYFDSPYAQWSWPP